MKKFIVLMVFAIGLFVSLPSTSSGSGSPPDYPSFAVDQPSTDFQVMAADQVKTANYALTFVSHQTFAPAIFSEKGGCFVVQGNMLELQATYLNDKNATFNATANNLMDKNDFRLCRYTKQNESQRLISYDTESRTHCTIRADSQG